MNHKTIKNQSSKLVSDQRRRPNQMLPQVQLLFSYYELSMTDKRIVKYRRCVKNYYIYFFLFFKKFNFSLLLLWKPMKLKQEEDQRNPSTHKNMNNQLFLQSQLLPESRPPHLKELPLLIDSEMVKWREIQLLKIMIPG